MRRGLILFSLIFAGELVFSLPFHVARFFRPTFLEVFDLSNAALGDVFAFYGIVAMLAYVLGGTVADRFSARKLMTFSLLATALGGIYLAQMPNELGLSLLFAYWGVTSIFLFWAALIKSTKEWGGLRSQGKAFGILDGGRGLIAAAVASLAVIVIKDGLPIELNDATFLQRKIAMQQVIYFYTFMTFLAAILVWLIVPDYDQQARISIKQYIEKLPTIVRSPVVWLQAVIVICAYCGFKGIDNYGLYAIHALDMNEIESAEFMAMAAYLRPLAAVSAGFLVDRYFASKIIAILFVLTLCCYIALAIIDINANLMWVAFANIIFTFVSVYALRGVYFALLEETKTQYHTTGVTIGLISFIGFTPDIFFAPITGRILDSSPGITGFQMYFGFLAVFMFIGLLATALLLRFRQRILK